MTVFMIIIGVIFMFLMVSGLLTIERGIANQNRLSKQILERLDHIIEIQKKNMSD